MNLKLIGLVIAALVVGGYWYANSQTAQDARAVHDALPGSFVETDVIVHSAVIEGNAVLATEDTAYPPSAHTASLTGPGALSFAGVLPLTVITVGDGCQYDTSTGYSSCSVPSTPQGFTASVNSVGTGINVAWTAPASNGGTSVTGYNLYSTYGTGSVSCTPGTGLSFPANQLSFSDSALGYGVTKSYSVTAVNAIGASACTTIARATTAAPTTTTTTPPPTTTSSGSTPSAPTFFAASADVTGNGVNLAWNAPTSPGSSPVSSYKLYAITGTGTVACNPANLYTTTAASQTNYQDTALGYGVARTYSLRAVNSAGDGACTSDIVATTRAVSSPTTITIPVSLTGSVSGVNLTKDITLQLTVSLRTASGAVYTQAAAANAPNSGGPIPALAVSFNAIPFTQVQGSNVLTVTLTASSVDLADHPVTEAKSLTMTKSVDSTGHITITMSAASLVATGTDGSGSVVTFSAKRAPSAAGTLV